MFLSSIFAINLTWNRFLGPILEGTVIYNPAIKLCIQVFSLLTKHWRTNSFHQIVSRSNWMPWSAFLLFWQTVKIRKKTGLPWKEWCISCVLKAQYGHSNGMCKLWKEILMIQLKTLFFVNGRFVVAFLRIFVELRQKRNDFFEDECRLESNKRRFQFHM